MTLYIRVIKALSRKPQQSATQLANSLGASASSVSSMLRKMVGHRVSRSPGGGPRGGYVYRLDVPADIVTSMIDMLDEPDNVLAVIPTLSPYQLCRVADWAGKEIYAASDNPVRRIKRPRCLPSR